jgi:hypothetical protein
MPRYALLLAADRYKDPQINPLRYAERDARVQEGFLRESARSSIPVSCATGQ